ncbi:TonB-dependent receptor plug domain-containing protein [Pseudomonadota bacterium]
MERLSHRRVCFGLTVLVLFFLSPFTTLAEEQVSTKEMLGLSMEELMNIKVISASKREEDYYSTAAAIFVISNDDIRRSGARSIPEALRLAPGVEVNRVNANQYAVAIRGQNDLFSDKLLVLMDGRTLYTPTTSGVFWLAQNYPLNDIERIEVIRGTSGAIWGANAVNGVINIITKNANDTTGTFISVGGGIEEKAFGTIRFGTESDKAAYRAYIMTEQRDGGIFPQESAQPIAFPGTQDSPDDRKFSQGGFRIDWLMDDRTDISFHGDLYSVKAGAFGTYVPFPFVSAEQPYTTTDSYRGYNLVTKIDREFSDESSLVAQLFFDEYNFDTISYGEKRDTFDIDLQYNAAKLFGNLISVGINYRNSRSTITDKPTLQMPDDSMNLISLFINDEIELIPNRLRLIAGAKFEKSSYMSWQIQPHLRAIYSEDHWSLWAAASKAVRSPNKAEESVKANVSGGFGFVVRGVGNGSVEPETVMSYEAGIRLHPNDNILFQLTAFRINYRSISDLNGDKLPTPIPGHPLGYLHVPFYYKNVLDGKTEGFEADITFQINDWAKIKGTYGFLHQSYKPVASLTSNPLLYKEALSTVLSTTKQSPKNRYSIGLSLDPTDSLELDVNLYGWSLYRDDNFGPGFLGVDRVVNSYNRVDARIGWQATDNMHITLAGQNLLKAAHREDVDSALEFSSLAQQSFYIKVDYQY